jgi:RimJ/RimL family protein N-acetyltransferase
VTDWNGIAMDDLVLHSGRLTLRPLQTADIPSLVDLLADQRVHAYLRLPNPYTSDDAEKFVAGAFRHPGSADFAVADNATGRMLGCAGIHGLTPGTHSAEIGYWLATAEWGHGYAGEATQALTRFAFGNGLTRLQIRCDTANVASARVALRCGYTFEGVARRDVRSSYGLADCAVFSRLDSDTGNPVAPTWAGMPELTDGVVTVRPMAGIDWPTVLADQNNTEAKSWSLFSEDLTEDRAREIASRAPMDWLVGQQARLVISDAATGAGAGVMTLRGFGPPGVVNVGYGVLPEFRGLRFTTRALMLLTDWAFAQPAIARLELGCKDGNIASARAAEAAGFVLEGVYAGRLRNTDGSYSDEIRFGRVRPAAN